MLECRGFMGKLWVKDFKEQKGMKKGAIVHAALLLANMVVFMGLVHGQAAGGGQGGAGVAGDGLSATLGVLLKEQALLREELGRLKSQADLRQASSRQAVEGDGNCRDDDNAPGVTVYLDTSQADARSARQWTAVSFKEVGPAPDGSKQAVMSIHKASVNPEAPGFTRVKNAAHWQ